MSSSQFTDSIYIIKSASTNVLETVQKSLTSIRVSKSPCSSIIPGVQEFVVQPSKEYLYVMEKNR